ncbi:MAG: hypothetical protein ACJ79K_02005 [Gemmatimonadaceae bacterium]
MAKGQFHIVPGAAVTMVALVLAACSAAPVVWAPASTRAGDHLQGRLVLDGVEPRFTVDTASLLAPQMPGACPASARVAVSGTSGVERYVAWWAPRADSSSALFVARSIDAGRSWSTPELVDSADHNAVGCNRPAPAIAADSSSGYVHVAYSMRDVQGAGVFFSHSMDRGRMFHSPVTIMYGDELTDAAIAARGDTVVVAFIDPSSDHPQVRIALSHTMGHIFEQRLTVPSSSDASEPAIAIAAGRVAVAWVHRVPDGAISVVVRSGRFGGAR